MPTTAPPAVRSRPRVAAVLATTLVAGVAAGAIALSGADAQEPAGRTLTFRETEKGATFVHVRSTKTKNPRSNNLGDVLALTQPLLDGAGKRIGTTRVQCVTTVGNASFEKAVSTCIGTMHLREGDLMAQFDLSPGDDVLSGAVTGGTGAYAGARGTFVSAAGKDGITTDTVTLLP